MNELYVLQYQNGAYELIGPLEIAQIVGKIKTNALSWMDLAFAPDVPERWSRLADVPALRGTLSRWPNRETLASAEERIKSRSESTPARKTPAPTPTPAPAWTGGHAGPWFLQFDGGEFGPFSPTELLKIVSAKKMPGRLFAWTKGLPSWVPVESPEEIQEVMKNPAHFSAKFNQGAIETGKNLRTATRRSLVATVRLTSSRDPVGICMDISTGGLQLFADSQCSLESGENCELEILPATMAKLGVFRVKARVLWKTEDKLGFQFLSISEADKNALEKYILKAQTSREA